MLSFVRMDVDTLVYLREGMKRRRKFLNFSALISWRSISESVKQCAGRERAVAFDGVVLF